MAVQLLTVAAYARHRGCDEKAVRKAIDENRITAIQTADGKRRIDPAVADIQWAQNTRARADSGRAGAAIGAGEGAGPDGATAADSAPSAQTAPGYSEYRALEAQEDLRAKRRNNLQAEGQLTEVVKARQAVFDAYRALRDKCFNVGPRAAPRCIGLGDARDVEHVITDEIRQAFAGWEEQMNRRLPPPQGDTE